MTFFERLDDAMRALARFQPDALVLGFDIYERDPQAKVAVTTAGFGRLGERIGELGLPTVIVQEGVSHRDAGGECAGVFWRVWGRHR